MYADENAAERPGVCYPYRTQPALRTMTCQEDSGGVGVKQIHTARRC